MIWLKRIGVTLLAVLAIVALWQGLLIVAAAVVFTIIGTYVEQLWRQWRSVQQFRRAWESRGKDLLLVYSNSPHWQRYVEQTWLPKWGNRAVVLNWSDRRSWERDHRPEVALFRAFAGDREFNPLAIVVPPEGRQVRIVRFWRAFRDYKHGKDGLLRAAETELERHLEHRGA